jgi:hypothetical protein
MEQDNKLKSNVAFDAKNEEPCSKLQGISKLISLGNSVGYFPGRPNPRLTPFIKKGLISFLNRIQK